MAKDAGSMVILFYYILKSQDYGDISAGARQGHLTMSWVVMTLFCQVSMVTSVDDVVVPGEHGDEWWWRCCARWAWWWVMMSDDDVVVPNEYGDEWWWRCGARWAWWRVLMTMLCQVSMVMSGDDVVVPGEHGDEWWLCCCARWAWWWVMMTMLCQVSMVMHGEYGMSETRELVSQDGQPLFERNSRDTFYITSVTLPASSVYCRSGNCDTSISLYVLIFWHFFVCVVIQIPYLFFFYF